MGRVFCIILQDPIGFAHIHTLTHAHTNHWETECGGGGGGAFMWQVREKLWQFLHLACSQLILEAAEINTSYSSGTQADYGTPPQKQSKWAKKGSDYGAINMLIRWSDWQIKMICCHVMVKVSATIKELLLQIVHLNWKFFREVVMYIAATSSNITRTKIRTVPHNNRSMTILKFVTVKN